MSQNFKVETFEPGQTLREWADCNPCHVNRPVIMFHNDFPVPRSQWDTVTLNNDSVVTIAEIVQGGGGGGGSNPLQVVMMVVVAVVSVYTFGAASAAYAAAYGAGAMATAVGAAAAAAVSIAGSFAMQMMFSSNPAMPSYSLPVSLNSAKQADAASPTYSLSAQNNSARLNQMIPECFGTNLQTLDRGAKPYSRFSGDEEYLQMLLVVGMGEYDIKQIYIEDTPIWKDGTLTGNFPEVQIEILNPGENTTIFKPNVEVANEVSGQQIENDGDSLGYFAVSPPNVEVDEIEVSLVMVLAKPEPTVTEQKTMEDGTIVNETTGGGLSAVSLTVLAEAVEIDNLGNPVGSPITVLNKTYAYASYDTKRVTEAAIVPKARYAVKLTRVSTTWTPNENDPENIEDQIRDQLYWSSAAGYVPEELTFPEGTQIAIKARASNALNQNVARQIKVLHQRKLPLWSNGSWSALTATNSAAAAICYVLKSKYGGRLTDANIDLESLWAADSVLQAKNYGVSGVIDSTVNVRSLLADFCTVAQLLIRVSSSGISFFIDEQRDNIAYSFDETNIMKDTFRYDTKFANENTVPDWLSFDYMDPDTGYALQQVPCKLIDSKNTQPTNKRMFASNRTQAFRAGMRELLAYRYRQKYISWTTGMEGFRRSFGDLVKVSNLTVDYSKRPSVGEVSEVINKYTLELDRPVIYNSGEEHLLSFVKKDGSLWGPVKIDSIAIGDFNTLISLNQTDYDNTESEQGEFTPVTGYNVTRTRFNFYTGSRRSDTVFITNVSPVNDTQIELGGFIDDDRAYTAESYIVPELDAIDEVTPSTDITGLTVATTWTGGTVSVSASWQPVIGAQHYNVDWSSDGLNWVAAGQPVGTSHSFTVNTAQLFYVRVAAMLEFQGPWAVWSGTGVEGAPEAPVPVVDSFDGNILVVSWPLVAAAADYVATVKRESVTVSTLIVATNTFTRECQCRYLNIFVQSRNSYGLSNFGYVAASHPPPDAPTNVQQPNPLNWQITWDAVIDNDLTGYIAMIGNTSGFVQDDAIQVIITGDTVTSATFSPLPAGTYYVRVAAKDLFYDNVGGDLNWTEIEI